MLDRFDRVTLLATVFALGGLGQDFKCKDILKFPEDARRVRAIGLMWSSCDANWQKKATNLVKLSLAEAPLSSDELLLRIEWLDKTPLRAEAEHAFSLALLREGVTLDDARAVKRQLQKLGAHQSFFPDELRPRYKDEIDRLQRLLFKLVAAANDPWSAAEFKPFVGPELQAVFATEIQRMLILRSQTSASLSELERICPAIEALSQRAQCHTRARDLWAAIALEKLRTADWKALASYQADFAGTSSERSYTFLLQQRLAAIARDSTSIEDIAQACSLITGNAQQEVCLRRLQEVSLAAAEHLWSIGTLDWTNVYQLKTHCHDSGCLTSVQKLEWRLGARTVLDKLASEEQRFGKRLFSKQAWHQVMEKLDQSAQIKFGTEPDGSFASLAPELRGRLVAAYKEAESESSRTAASAGEHWNQLQLAIEHSLGPSGWAAGKAGWIQQMDAILSEEDYALGLDADQKWPQQVRQEILRLKWRLDQPEPASQDTKSRASMLPTPNADLHSVLVWVDPVVSGALGFVPNPGIRFGLTIAYGFIREVAIRASKPSS